MSVKDKRSDWFRGLQQAQTDWNWYEIEICKERRREVLTQHEKHWIMRTLQDDLEWKFRRENKDFQHGYSDFRWNKAYRLTEEK